MRLHAYQEHAVEHLHARRLRAALATTSEEAER